MKNMTPGELAVWAARFNQTQTDIVGDFQTREASRMADARAAGTPAEPLDPQVALQALMHATGVAIEQAHNSIVLLRAVPVPEGAAGEMLRDVLGRPAPVMMPAPLDFLPEPYNLAEPPPGMMFPDGRTDVVHAVETEGPVELVLVELAAAWERHLEACDPPAYRAVAVDGTPFDDGPTDHEWQPVLRRPDGGEMALHAPFPTQAQARSFLWCCHEKPAQVSFWARFGERLGIDLVDVLGWTDQQLAEAWAYLQARAGWEASRPAPPEFWCSNEE